MPYMLDGRQLRVGRPFKTTDGVSYSQLWATQLSDEQKTELGITFEADPVSYNSRFNFDAETPRDVDQLKTEFTAEQKEVAASQLATTDWYVTRKTETDTAIPEAVTTYRAAVRTACAAREAEIAAVSTTAELEALMSASAQILDTDGETYITNPAALTQWPEA